MRIFTCITNITNQQRCLALCGVVSIVIASSNLCVLAAANTSAATNTAVGVAIDRPAVTARQASRATLLSASRLGNAPNARLIAVGERGLIIYSDDEGASWQQAKSPVSVTLTTVRFADAQNGFAVGHAGVVLATQDGGLTWIKKLDGVKAAAIALAAAQQNGDAKLIKDSERLVADGGDKPFLDAVFFDAKNGFIVGAYNLAFSTQDGGDTWVSAMAQMDNPKGLHLNTLRVRGNTMLIAGEQGLVRVSEDRGRTFKRLNVPYQGSFFTAEIMSSDGSNLWLAGLRGNIWRSSDSGVTWGSVPSVTAASITASAVKKLP